jgi:nitrite reductase/ring-hydroxylating ferredoxin subunit
LAKRRCSASSGRTPKTFTDWPDMEKHIVARVDEVPPGEHKKISVKGRDIALFNLGGEFFALGDKCPHESGSLCAGKVVGLAESDEPGKYRLSRPGEFVKCPWHGWEFDIRTGKSWCDPSRVRARTYAVSVESGASLVEGPYTAETFPVTVEDEYVVVEA